MDLASLRTTLFKMLPILLAMMILAGIAYFAIRIVIPHWQDYSDTSSTVETERAVVATQLAGDDSRVNQAILQHQIDHVQATLNSVGDNFLSQAESDQVLNRLYAYAYSRGVRIVNLQAQQAAAQPSARSTPVRGGNKTSTPVASAPYETNTFQLQVGGGVANLVDFIAHFQEASLPSVNIVSMNVTLNQNQSLLTMTLIIYTSPYASGKSLDKLAPVPTIPPSDTPTPTDTPSDTPTPLPAVIVTLPPPTPTFTASFTPTLTSTLTPSLTPTATVTPTLATYTVTPVPSDTQVICPNAPPTLLQAGEIAVVHFSGLGALRVLSDPNGSVMSTRTQAYDKQRLQIIAGPVCGTGAYYWYIRNLSADNALGWVAEAKDNERWLCPEDNPLPCTP